VALTGSSINTSFKEADESSRNQPNAQPINSVNGLSLNGEGRPKGNKIGFESDRKTLKFMTK
jgi:hypothetical protein